MLLLLFYREAAVLSQSQVQLTVLCHSKWICAFLKDRRGREERKKREKTNRCNNIGCIT